MMLLSLLPMLLLLSLVGAQSRTYRATDPSTGGALECDLCPPGTHLLERCTSARGTRCSTCPPGTFTELWNYIPKCLRCGACGDNQVVKTTCAPDSDCACECAEGFYYKKSYEMCLRHRPCGVGEGVLAAGTPDNDTMCQVCPNGSYSDTVSAQQNCTVHQSCHAPGQTQLLKGSTWHDSVCANCDSLTSRDGADYLKEILPAFFARHQISAKRLRQILHRLHRNPTEASGLQKQISDWVSSATASQIRQFIEVVKKVGEQQAGTRLHNKLQRIDSNLRELCFIGNEVDV